MSSAVFYYDLNADRIPYVFEETKDLIIPEYNPDHKVNMKDEKWRKLFEWYNRHFAHQGFPLQMTCKPCYTKVIRKFIEYRGKYNSIVKNK